MVQLASSQLFIYSITLKSELGIIYLFSPAKEIEFKETLTIE